MLRAHHPVATWPGGSSQGHVSRTKSPAGVAADGPGGKKRRALALVQLFLKRRRWRRLGRGCLTCARRTFIAETWQSAFWPGWGFAAWVACCKVPIGTLRSGVWATPAGSPGSMSATPVKEAPVTMRQRSAPASNECPAVAACQHGNCLLYTSPSPRDQRGSRMPSSA